MRELWAVGLLGLLAACGGDGGQQPPTAPGGNPSPSPTPVTYDGTYASTTMRVSGGWIVTASVSVSHEGASLSFTNLEVTEPDWGWYGMGRAALDGHTFEGTKQYSTQSCGMATNHYTGWFSASGDLMNLTCRITSSCADWSIRGEMRRQP
jgi:hypothetical protein